VIKLEQQIILDTIDLIMNSITQETFVTIDISDIKHIFKNRKTAAISSAESGSHIEAAEKAISNQLHQINNIKGALIFIQGKPDMTLDHAKTIVEVICKDLSDNVDIIWNASVKEELKHKFKVNIVFTK